MNQQRFLKGLVSEPFCSFAGSGLEGKPVGVKPFASDFIQRYGLRSASNVQRAIEPLLKRDVIDRGNGSFVIIDRFFKVWIQKIQI
jgi:hypothetical protein